MKRSAQLYVLSRERERERVSSSGRGWAARSLAGVLHASGVVALALAGHDHTGGFASVGGGGAVIIERRTTCQRFHCVNARLTFKWLACVCR